MKQDNYDLRRMISSRLRVLAYQKSELERKHDFDTGDCPINATERSFVRLSKLARERGMDVHDEIKLYNRTIYEDKLREYGERDRW